MSKRQKRPVQTGDRKAKTEVKDGERFPENR